MDFSVTQIVLALVVALLIIFSRNIIGWVGKTNCKNCPARVWRWHVVHCKECGKSSCRQCATPFGPGEMFKGTAVRCPGENCSEVIMLKKK